MSLKLNEEDIKILLNQIGDISTDIQFLLDKILHSNLEAETKRILKKRVFQQRINLKNLAIKLAISEVEL